ncbi:hypothetical protein T02_11580 [Trichinella nativa]|uniref:Uncharacterized protein n=1 Tax=Trichinella nativa TaxID=6335 RepID=A0A0V1L9X8_9BILA|nr:hypothetical protein T02_11580 [Trichinella nativa]
MEIDYVEIVLEKDVAKRKTEKRNGGKNPQSEQHSAVAFLVGQLGEGQRIRAQQPLGSPNVRGHAGQFVNVCQQWAVSIGLFPYPEKTPSFACSSNSDAFSVWQIVAAKLFSLLLNRLKSASTSWLTIRPRHHRENHHKLESNRQRKHCKSVSQITKNSFTSMVKI